MNAWNHCCSAVLCTVLSRCLQLAVAVAVGEQGDAGRFLFYHARLLGHLIDYIVQNQAMIVYGKWDRFCICWFAPAFATVG